MMPSAHISRAEAALCLLSELALHHEAAFREHLPVVLLVCIIKADASVPLVHEHAQQVRCCASPRTQLRCSFVKTDLSCLWCCAVRPWVGDGLCVLHSDGAGKAHLAVRLQMLTHLVYAMSAQALAGSGMAGAQEAVANVIWELQSASAQPLWPAEVTALEAADNKSYPTLRRLVQRLVDCIFFEAELQVKWVRSPLRLAWLA